MGVADIGEELGLVPEIRLVADICQELVLVPEIGLVADICYELGPVPEVGLVADICQELGLVPEIWLTADGTLGKIGAVCSHCWYILGSYNFADMKIWLLCWYKYKTILLM